MKKSTFWGVMVSSLLILSSCETDGPSPDGVAVETERFVVAATSSKATYLLTSDSLSQGHVSIFENGTEVDNASAWIFWKDKYAYRLVYNQGSAGITTSYMLDNKGEIKLRNISHEIQNRFTTYGTSGDLIITAASGATDNRDNNNNPQYGVTFTKIDVQNQTLSTQTVVTENLLGTGEYCTLSGIIESNGKIYSGVCPEGVSVYGMQNNNHLLSDQAKALVNQAGGISGTVNPNNVWVAIYNNGDLTSPKIIQDNRISYATARYRSQYYSTIDTDSNGNVYVFSPSYATTQSGIQKTSLPSGVIRINAGQEVFDNDYYVNFEDPSVANRAMYKVWHIKGDYFLMQMYAEKTDNKSHTANTHKLGIFKAGSKEFKWISGLPEATEINSLSKNAYSDGTYAYIAVTPITTEAKPTVYVIDPITASATTGLAITANGVAAIGKLSNKQ